jgi:zinc transport system substrate-binding protein
LQKFVWIALLFVIVGIVVWILVSGVDRAKPARAAATVSPPQAQNGPMSVFVSIPPLKYVAERIGGDKVTVRAMVRPGTNPHTFEPLPDQLAGLLKAKIFFLVGDPSELAWLEKARASYPGVAFIETDAAVLKRPADGEVAGHGGGDPHIWLAPKLLALQARSMAAVFLSADKPNAPYYKERLDAFTVAMEALDTRISILLAPFKGRSFIVFHPSWGYFADAYGLKQAPMEMAGKEPGARHLAAVTDIVRREKVSSIFTAPQFPVREAQAIAEATGARVVTIDPLVEDVDKNLWAVAEALAASFGGVK